MHNHWALTVEIIWTKDLNAVAQTIRDEISEMVKKSIEFLIS